MRFFGTLRRITMQILHAEPQLVPVYLGKVDLANSAVGTLRGHTLCILPSDAEESYWRAVSGFSPGPSHGIRGQHPLLLHVHGDDSGHGE